MATTAAQSPYTTGLSDREGVIDACLRWSYGIDKGDRSLLASSMAAEVRLDLSAYKDKGFDLQDTCATREQHLDGLLETMGRMDTLHLLSNFRVALLTQSTAEVMCNVQAHHYRLGEGVKTGDRDCFVMAHEYHAALVRDDISEGSLWRIKYLKTFPRYVNGDHRIIGLP
ncbi:uncharacterized protein Z518_03499 [Rhinocladiella mackenziei CBS 650.93]|uniref:SnoaL-like domain-containing protein n=1 Tax=Rhinocladiella mackenziei CBS 650.93 TaxID=1442369 RepID=A0A0D2G2R5_9EURO|nr:uncharacterized protein Z518_03499 [Rhinocladiella mackenziei CBS 650.93]KIX08842.1 hypothetical protein Z518_03499 [Rhinocladiella mackenziei CBS 650.93]